MKSLLRLVALVLAMGALVRAAGQSGPLEILVGEVEIVATVPAHRLARFPGRRRDNRSISRDPLGN